MSKKNILLLEDDRFTREMIKTGLTKEGYAVACVADIKSFSEKLLSVKPDIILMDLMLPDGNSLDIIKNIRLHTGAPIIVISSKGELVDKVVGLEMGADDYVSKPVQLKEIAARIKAHLRRSQPQAETPRANKQTAARVGFGPWILDREQLQVFGQDGKPAGLTVKEFQLLEIFVSSPNHVLSRQHLLDLARADDYNVTDRAIDMQIMRIRKKLGGSEELIRSIRGAGYMFVLETKPL